MESFGYYEANLAAARYTDPSTFKSSEPTTRSKRREKTSRETVTKAPHVVLAYLNGGVVIIDKFEGSKVWRLASCLM